ncbi:uncharacterized protein [Physcomitrium patens]|uniref:uncharacterized protein n=1 Tax=Physcomitrium patens TaxID=3218 RepID=UPI003CCE36C4
MEGILMCIFCTRVCLIPWSYKHFNMILHRGSILSRRYRANLLTVQAIGTAFTAGGVQGPVGSTIADRHHELHSFITTIASSLPKLHPTKLINLLQMRAEQSSLEAAINIYVISTNFRDINGQPSARAQLKIVSGMKQM